MAYQFMEPKPSLESQWRSIILFGRNVASYKFALGKALIALARENHEVVILDALALPFAVEVAAHLRNAPRQSTAASSRFLDACRGYNEGSTSEEDLRELTARLGFINVIDAFHVVGSGPTEARFFEDERRGKVPAIRLTDELFRLLALQQAENLPHEVEDRWRLVERAWSLNMTARLLQVDIVDNSLTMLADRGHRRTAVASARGALSGYQKGRCFYCRIEISVEPGSDLFCDVDHVLPFVVGPEFDRVWNLVLACVECNRGLKGKFDRIPSLECIGRLHTRNEYLISSHHPLRETLMQQTGVDELRRGEFLQGQFERARDAMAGGQFWTPTLRGPEPGGS